MPWRCATSCAIAPFFNCVSRFGPCIHYDEFADKATLGVSRNHIRVVFPVIATFSGISSPSKAMGCNHEFPRIPLARPVFGIMPLQGDESRAQIRAENNHPEDAAWHTRLGTISFATIGPNEPFQQMGANLVATIRRKTGSHADRAKTSNIKNIEIKPFSRYSPAIGFRRELSRFLRTAGNSKWGHEILPPFTEITLIRRIVPLDARTGTARQRSRSHSSVSAMAGPWL